MNIAAPLLALGHDWVRLGNIIFVLLIIVAVLSIRWRNLLDNDSRVHALVGLLFCTSAIWQLGVQIHPGFKLHLIWANLFQLMFGWPIALTSLALIMLGTSLITAQDISTLGVNGILMLVIPIFFSEVLLRFSQRYLPKNPFVFLLFYGFAGAAIGFFFMYFATIVLLALVNFSWPVIHQTDYVSSLAFMYSEAFSTGSILAAFVVTKPEAVKCFFVEAS